jgi:hypothetical protein
MGGCTLYASHPPLLLNTSRAPPEAGGEEQGVGARRRCALPAGLANGGIPVPKGSDPCPLRFTHGRACQTLLATSRVAI